MVLPVGVAVVVAAAIWLIAVNARAGSLPVDDEDALKRTHSLGWVIQHTDPSRPIHLVFVHGMRETGPGSAQTFMQGLCRYAPVTCDRTKDFAYVERRALALSPASMDAEVLDQKIWRRPGDWEASQPFVDRYVFPREGKAPIVVDEVNWWPLLFPLKCRFLVAPEAQLSGVDKQTLALCMRTDKPFHAWLTPEEYAKALAGPKISGGGVRVNGGVKRAIMNWGLADAVIALGPMRRLFRETMDQAFEYAETYDGRSPDEQEFVVISESLGSFVVMDAAANRLGDSPHARNVVTRSSDLYFFANQFALLELGRITGLSGELAPVGVTLSPDVAGAATETSPSAMLKSWALAGTSGHPGFVPPRPRQIIAFSDPSDALTFDVPRLTRDDGSEAAIVVNVYDRNEFNWFGVAVDPVKAHTGHSANQAVLKMMFQP